MNILTNLILVMIFTGLNKFFNKKLVVLLILESFMISIIFGLNEKMLSEASYFFFLLMALMMVLDSVFSISILIFTTRNSSKMSSASKYL